ncbi:RNA-dependent RNA polymerase [Lisianthus necrotic ringspot virus]|uniref:RNA-directed RNA polymerase L n=1 Tax=Lisianthus necrotic ringspot virus TaxID=1398661 RepID=A0AAD0PA64_9VIRU|nr:RNA-dependent RNA polymerase [Lisianthus necrotic ringspot virus]
MSKRNEKIPGEREPLKEHSKDGSTSSASKTLQSNEITSFIENITLLDRINKDALNKILGIEPYVLGAASAHESIVRSCYKIEKDLVSIDDSVKDNKNDDLPIDLENASSLIRQYYTDLKDVLLKRHDLFGLLVSKYLRFQPSVRNDVLMSDAIHDYLDELQKNVELDNHLNPELDVKSRINTDLLTPDNYVMFKEPGTKKLGLIIYDWKVSINSHSEIETTEKYYKSIYKTFEEIYIDGKPFLEDHPVYICVVILSPMGTFSIETRLSRVIQEFSNSPYKTVESRKIYSEKSKMCRVKIINDIDNTGDYREFYTLTQMMKNKTESLIPSVVSGEDIFFTHFSHTYRNTDLSDNCMSDVVREILENIHDDIYTNSQMKHYILGNFVFFESTMSEEHFADRMKGYIANCKFMGINPKSKPEKLKAFLSLIQEKKQVKLKAVLNAAIEASVKKKKEKILIKTSDEAFEIASKKYGERYKGCYVEKLSKTKTNFPIPWVPNIAKIGIGESDYHNSITNVFRSALRDVTDLIYNKIYGELEEREISNIMLGLVKTCLVNHSCDTSKFESSKMEDVININNGNIEVERSSDSKKFRNYKNMLVRTKNEFKLGSKDLEFIKGMRVLRSGMSKRERRQIKMEREKMVFEAVRNIILEDKAQHTTNPDNKREHGSKLTDKEDTSKSLIYDISAGITISQEEYNSVAHEHRVIHYQDQAAMEKAEQIKDFFLVLASFDTRDNSGKITKVYQKYVDSFERLFTKKNLLGQEKERAFAILKCLKDLSVLHRSEDYMQFSKSLMVADRYMPSNGFKIITTANKNMLMLAFKGDGMNKMGAGVPYVTVLRVPKQLVESTLGCYTKEVLCYFLDKNTGDYIMITRPQRLNQVRLLSLFKSPSKVPILFSHFCSSAKEFRDNHSTMNSGSISLDGILKPHISNILFSSFIIGTVTSLSRMAIFDFMRYAGFLPLSDYSNVNDYIAEKYDPELTSVVDMFFLTGIRSLLREMENLELSKKSVPMTIDQEMDMSGGIEGFNIKCPLTRTTLSNIEHLFNNVYAAVYMQPKSLHHRKHNLGSLVQVPAEYELKARMKAGLGPDDPMKPMRWMFAGPDDYAIDGVLNVIGIHDYYMKTVKDVSMTRNNIMKEEMFNLPCYKINTLSSSKKCSKLDNISDKEIIECVERCKKTRMENIHKLSARDKHIVTGMIKARAEDRSSFRYYLNSRKIDLVSTEKWFSIVSNKEIIKYFPCNNEKFATGNNPVVVETYYKIRFSECQEVTFLKSHKVSEELYDLIKEYHSMADLDWNYLRGYKKGSEGKKHTFIQMLEFIVKRTKISINHMGYLVSVFEKHQRTKVDREIYLMSMRVKMTLYYIEHFFKHIAQSDPSEAISVSGDQKIKVLVNLSIDTFTEYNEIIKESSDSAMAFLSADMSKWSASDQSYKYILTILMNPCLTTGEQNLMVECLMMYIQYKQISIPVDIYDSFKKNESNDIKVQSDIRVLTNNFTRNCFPVGLNWLQGNLNYLSSVYHSIAMNTIAMVLAAFPGVLITMRHMVHSDDNVTSLVVRAGLEILLKAWDAKDLPELLFRVCEVLLKYFCITLNTKKSYASTKELEFTSERIINGAIIPLWCRNTCNLGTESSHLSYFDDAMSLANHLTQLLRKGCPNELMPFCYAAVQCQSLSIYSMLPGEENDIVSIVRSIGLDYDYFELPIAVGGWISLSTEMMAILGPSCNDQMIYYSVLKEIMKSKDFADLKKSFNREKNIGTIAMEIFDDKKQGILNELQQRCLFLMNMFKASLSTEDSQDVEMGVRFQTMMSQIIKLPNYVNENAMKSLSSFNDFVKLFPYLKKNERLLMAIKCRNLVEGLNSEEELLAQYEIEKLYEGMMEKPESYLISPLNDMDYLMSKIINYSSISKRYQLSNQNTEKLALDRILRSKAKTFINPLGNEKMTYRENLESKLLSMKEDIMDNSAVFMTACRAIVRDVNFEMALGIIDQMQPNQATPKQNYNFKWFRTEKFDTQLEGSPGLIIINQVYGSNYIENLGLKNIPLTVDSMNIVQSLFGLVSTFDDISRVARGETKMSTEEFINSCNTRRQILSVNYMVQAQNRLLAVNTCYNRKNFPFYSRYNTGKTFNSNVLSLLSTIYSRTENIYFYSSVEYLINRNTRLTVDIMRDVNLLEAVDSAVYISDRLQSLFPEISTDDIKFILSKMNIAGFNMLDMISKDMSNIRRTIREVRNRPFVEMSLGPKLHAVSNFLPWLFNMGLIGQEELSFISRKTRREEVMYIKSGKLDEMGCYNDGEEIKLGLKTDFCFGMLCHTELQTSISIKTPYTQFNDANEIVGVIKSVCLSLIKKIINDKRDIFRLKQPYDVDLVPSRACIRLSSSGKLIAHMNSSNRVEKVSNVKCLIDVEITDVMPAVWDILGESSTKDIRKAVSGECFSQTHTLVKKDSKHVNLLLDSLRRHNGFYSGVNMIKQEVNNSNLPELSKTMLRDAIDTFKGSISKGLEDFTDTESFDKFLQDTEFSEVLETQKELMEAIADDEEDLIEMVQYLDKAAQFMSTRKERIDDFKKICEIVKFTMSHVNQSYRIRRPTGDYFPKIVMETEVMIAPNYSKESIKESGILVKGILDFLRYCEICYKNNLVLNVNKIKLLRTGRYVVPSNIIYLDKDLSNDIMSAMHDYKTVVVGKLEMDERISDLLEYYGFKFAGEAIKDENRRARAEFVDSSDLAGIGDYRTEDKVKRLMTFVKKRPASLMPSNTLIIGEVLKFYCLGLNGGYDSTEALLEAAFGNRMESEIPGMKLKEIRNCLASLELANTINKHYTLVKIDLKEISDSINDLFKFLNIDLDRKIVNSANIISRLDTSDRESFLKSSKNYCDWMSFYSSCFNDQTMVGSQSSTVIKDEVTRATATLSSKRSLVMTNEEKEKDMMDIFG